MGIANVIPKWIAYRLIEPALKLPETVRLVCIEDRFERLLAELAVHHLDVVLADAPCGPTVKVRAYNHLLGDCGVSVFGAERLAKSRRRGFPRSLEGAPMLMPRERLGPSPRRSTTGSRHTAYGRGSRVSSTTMRS